MWKQLPFCRQSKGSLGGEASGMPRRCSPVALLAPLTAP